MSADRPSDELLARVLSGNSAPGEVAEVAAWVGTNPERQRELELLQQLWSGSAPGSWDVDRAWLRAKPELAADATVLPLRRREPLRAVWAAAAGAVLVIGLATAWLVLRTPGASTAQVYATAAGERREVILPDSSVAVIAPRSTLTVAANYGSDNRTVTLDGEAWFSATHRAGAPFVVATPTHVVRDVGTVFTVSARGEAGLQVTVLEGEVAVRTLDALPATEQRLTAGNTLRLAAGVTPTVALLPQPDTVASWRTGTLDVTDATTSSVITRLVSWYEVPIELGDTAFAGRTVTGVFSLDSLDQALEVLSLLLDARVERESGRIVLRPRR